MTNEKLHATAVVEADQTWTTYLKAWANAVRKRVKEVVPILWSD